MSFALAERSATAEERFLQTSTRFWHPVVRSVDLPPGAIHSATLLSRPLAVFRNFDGSVAALDAVCAHRGADLSDGLVTPSGCLRCPYHGWEYGTDGQCTFVPQAPAGPIPARAHVGAYRCTEVADLVWVWLSEEEPVDLPSVPESVLDGWMWVVWPSFSWEANAFRQIENFCDQAHFSILHTGTFGYTDRPEVDPYHVETSADGNMLEWQFDYAMVDRRQEPWVVTPTHWVYRIRVPFVSCVELRDPATRELRRLFVNFAVPTTASRTVIFYAAVLPEDTTDEQIDASHASSVAIFEEDRRIVERQRPTLLFLDAPTDLHAFFDRYSVAYRRALARLSF